MGIPTHILVFGLSVLLHVSVLGLGLLQLSSSKHIRVDLSKPVVYQVDLVRLDPPAPGRPAPLAPSAPAPAPPTPAVQEQPKPAPKPQVTPPAPPQPKAEVPIPEPPKPTPEPKPAPKPESKSEPKPEPPKPAPSPPKPPEPPRQPARTEPTREQIMAEALGAVQRDVTQRAQPDARDQALAGLRQSGATGPGGADGQAGSGYGGLLEVYAQMVETRVKAQWRFPKGASRQDLSAVLDISLDRDGRVLGSRVVRSSGHSGFDASIERAVEETGQLPPPPRPDLRTIRITFNLQEL